MTIANSNNLTIILFTPYSSGNFLANVLSYNKNFIPKYNLQKNILPNLLDYTDINHKHNTILRSVPEKNQVTNWHSYELLCTLFYSKDTYVKPYPNWETEKDVIQILRNKKLYISTNKEKINKFIPKFLEANIKIFGVAHLVLQVDLIKLIFPEAKVIQLVNYEKIRELSIKLKVKHDPTHFFHLIKDHHLVTYKDAYQFDIGTLFDKDAFFKEVYKLLDWYDIEDKTLHTNVNEYYEKYVGLYA